MPEEASQFFFADISSMPLSLNANVAQAARMSYHPAFEDQQNNRTI
jgi:hypothetical protein